MCGGDASGVSSRAVGAWLRKAGKEKRPLPRGAHGRVLPWGLGGGVLSVLFAEWVQKVLCMALPLWYHSAACF